MKLISLAVLGVIACLQPSAVQAGAWPRGKGKTFTASSASLTWPDQRTWDLPDVYGSAYLEHGVSPRLTMGLEIGSPDATRPERMKTVGFLRYTLTAPNSSHQIAVDAGGGRYLDSDVFRIGASYGFGFKSFNKGSWISLDAHALRATISSKTAYSLDATYGISLKSGKLMGQFSAYQAYDKVQTVSVTSAYAHDLGQGRHLEIGVTWGVQGKPDPALKIGIWQEF